MNKSYSLIEFLNKIRISNLPPSHQESIIKIVIELSVNDSYLPIHPRYLFNIESEENNNFIQGEITFAEECKNRILNELLETNEGRDAQIVLFKDSLKVSEFDCEIEEKAEGIKKKKSSQRLLGYEEVKSPIKTTSKSKSEISKESDSSFKRKKRIFMHRKSEFNYLFIVLLLESREKVQIEVTRFLHFHNILLFRYCRKSLRIWKMIIIKKHF